MLRHAPAILFFAQPSLNTTFQSQANNLQFYLSLSLSRQNLKTLFQFPPMVMFMEVGFSIPLSFMTTII